MDETGLSRPIYRPVIFPPVPEGNVVKDLYDGRFRLHFGDFWECPASQRRSIRTWLVVTMSSSGAQASPPPKRPTDTTVRTNVKL